MELEGGSYLWKNILYFWPLEEERNLKNTGIPDMSNCQCEKILKNSFSLKLNSSRLNNSPILIFYCGMGKTLLPLQVFIYNLLNTIKSGIYPIIFSINHMAIHDIPELVEESIQLYNYVDKKYPNHKKVLIGHSLGSGVAAQVAQSISLKKNAGNLKGVLLLSTSPNITDSIKPFSFLKNVIKSIANFFLGTILDTEKALELIDAPVKIIHTLHDKMFSIKCIRPMKKIKSKFTDQYPMYEEREGSHGKIIENVDVLANDILKFLKY